MEDFYAKWGYSPQTRENYKRARAQFVGWCAAMAADPTSAAAAEAYLRLRTQGDVDGLFAGESRRLAAFGAVASLNIAIAALRQDGLLPAAGLPEQKQKERALKNYIAAHAGEARKRANPLYAPQLARILAAPAPSGAAERGKALAALGWLSLLRLDEMRNLRIADYDDNGFVVRLRVGKTLAAGNVARVSLRLAQQFSALRQVAGAALLAFEGHLLRRRRMPRTTAESFIFCGSAAAATSRQGAQIGKTQAQADLKAAARAAGLASACVSGHSMRRGAAQDLLNEGLSLYDLKQAGRWKSLDCLKEYLAQPAAADEAGWKAGAA